MDDVPAAAAQGWRDSCEVGPVAERGDGLEGLTCKKE